MTTSINQANADRRHLAGFRKFQRAALRAVDIVARSLVQHEGDCEARARALVKVSDMRSLVSAYKDAVVGERMVLRISAGQHAAGPGGETEGLCLRWVVDETAGPGGADAAVE
jgi:hypothetical protein